MTEKIEKRLKIERLIITLAVDCLLRVGFWIEVDSRAHYSVSRDGKTVMQQIYRDGTDEIFLRVFRMAGGVLRPMGHLQLALSLDEPHDVLVDYTTNLALTLVPALELAEHYASDPS